MRLYQDIKIQLKANFEIRLEERVECEASIKKYNGKTTIGTIKGDKKLSDYESYVRSLDIPIIVLQNLVDVSNVNYENYSIKIMKTEGDFSIIDRLNAKLTYNYNTRVLVDYTFDVFGRLYMNPNDSFEDNFKTDDGLSIREIVPTEQIKKAIYEKIKDECPNTDIVITYQFENDVKILPNNYDIMGVVVANKSELLWEMSDDIRDYFKNDYD